ncbi:MAG: redoxin domain-containing protein [Candidatus Binatia bacterium]
MLKSIFISVYIGASVSGLVLAIVKMTSAGISSPWLGTAVACAGPVAFFATVFALPIARTSPNLHAVLAAGVIGVALSLVLGEGYLWPATIVAATAGVAGTFLYVYWYSRFDAPTDTPLREGNRLPDFPLVEHGRDVESRELLLKPALWIFYRGNWCPLCVAQIGEICAQYRNLAERGIEVFLVSPQPERNTAALAARCDAPMRYMTDRGNRAAAALGILVKAGIPAGLQALGYDSDTPRPTVFITAADGRIAYCDMTDNYRVRPEPAQYLPVLERLAAA